MKKKPKTRRPTVREVTTAYYEAEARYFVYKGWVRSAAKYIANHQFDLAMGNMFMAGYYRDEWARSVNEAGKMLDRLSKDDKRLYYSLTP